MNEWELTEDELVETLATTEGIWSAEALKMILTDKEKTLAGTIAQAAQKKLLDWLKSHGYYYKPDSKYKTLFINDIVCDQECWVVIIPKE